MLVLGLISLVTGLTCPSKQVCVDIQQKGSVYQFNISGTPQKGYMALGLGESMAKADMFVVWFGGSGQPMVSHRTSSKYAQPAPRQAALNINSHDVNKRYIAFECPLPQPQGFATLSATGMNQMIWAYSPKQPDSKGNIAYHEARGVFGYSFQDSAPIEIVPRIPAYIVWHRILMILAWLVFPSAAIFIARFLKDRLGALWFTLHRGMFLLSGGLALLAILLIFLQEGVVTSPHAIIGMLVMISYLGQVVLGFIIDKLWSPENPEAPWHDKLHWWIGRSLVILALVNIIYGIVLLGTPASFYIPVVLLFFAILIAFSTAEKKIGKVVQNNQIPDTD